MILLYSILMDGAKVKQLMESRCIGCQFHNTTNVILVSVGFLTLSHNDLHNTRQNNALLCFMRCYRAFIIKNMKKVLSIIFLTVITLGIFAVLIYQLYLKPLSEIKGLDKWYEYIIAIVILSIIYTLIFFAIKGIHKLIDKAVSNLD